MHLGEHRVLSWVCSPLLLQLTIGLRGSSCVAGEQCFTSRRRFNLPSATSTTLYLRRMLFTRARASIQALCGQSQNVSAIPRKPNCSKKKPRAIKKNEFNSPGELNEGPTLKALQLILLNRVISHLVRMLNGEERWRFHKIGRKPTIR